MIARHNKPEIFGTHVGYSLTQYEPEDLEYSVGFGRKSLRMNI